MKGFSKKNVVALVSFMDSRLLNKFRGCLVGALIGDCFGAPFEGERWTSGNRLKSKVSKFCDELLKSDNNDILRYTDDTAMTWDIAESLLNASCLHPADIAKRFCDTYYFHQAAEIDRGYGKNVVDVFAKWKTLSWSDADDPYAAGREQFGGDGSCGNGGAMRISPVALFYALHDREKVIEVASKSALLTHTHVDGFNGAILQCLAIWRLLSHGQVETSPFDAQLFLDRLIDDMKSLESGGGDSEKVAGSYTSKLLLIKKYLSTPLEVSDKKIVETLGNGVRAPRSVPTALYIFLKNTLPDVTDTLCVSGRFDGIMREAISLGGDTDTIASMTCSLAGTHYGFDVIQVSVYRHCEGVQNALRLADSINSLLCKQCSN